MLRADDIILTTMPIITFTALKEQILARNVASLVVPPRVAAKEVQPLSPQEAQKLFKLDDGLRIELVMSDRFFDLSKGEADIAIRSRGGEPEDEALVGRKITDLHWALYASRAYVERHGQPKQPGDIRNHRIIQCTGGMASHAASRWLRAKAPQAIVGAYSESWPGLVMALKSGAGIAALPIAHGDGEPELVRVTDQLPDLVTHLYLLSHRDMQRAPRIRAFFDFVAAEIKSFRSALTKPQGKDHRASLSGPDLGMPTNERR
jgi:DNA-binding transcriptional LysR family regulator